MKVSIYKPMKNNPPPSIFLIGPMGAGKTTIGKLLAKKLSRKFIDVDRYIEDNTGADIPWIFAKEGESGFRDREQKAIEKLTAMNGIVLATGGGAVIREKNRQNLEHRGLTVYLNADISVQLKRTKKDTKRPLLQTENPELKLQQLYDIRSPFYQAIADIEVTSGHHYPKKMVLEVLKAIKSIGYRV